ncbi:MAG TPA: universal stress protein [Xanthobacteraceae bacterium]|jgi:nucleotide-binding universal stress UspA family protein
MSYAALLVYVEAYARPEERVRLAAELADRFKAQLIGLSALAIPPPIVADGMILSGPTETDIKLMQAKLAEKGAWFCGLAGGESRKSEWRSALDFPSKVLAREARSSDLVVIGQKPEWRSGYQSVDPGGAILKMGRPTLVVPERTGTLRADRIVLGWKDTREARRAARDALPFLQKATRVTIVEVCEEGEEKTALGRLDDVARYLSRHQVEGGLKVTVRQSGSGAAQLSEIAQEEHADLLVTGAYGHSRLDEGVFGGVTRELLSDSPICCLMSH